MLVTHLFILFFGFENPNQSLRTQETFLDRCPLVYSGEHAYGNLLTGLTQWLKTAYNVCGLACILRLTSSNRQDFHFKIHGT